MRMSFKNLIRLVLVVTVLFNLIIENYYGAEGAKYRLSKEQDLEFQKQLKILNKPPVKSFRTKFGDIFDCVDMYKQPAFDHPLLKNHKIQMKPSLVLQEEQMDESTSSKFLSSDVKKSEDEFRSRKCPTGTVPIRRTKKEELVNAKYFSRWINSHRNNRTNIGRRNYHYVSAQLSDGKPYFGAVAKINTRNPLIETYKPQFSTGQVWIQNGLAQETNSIEFGWAVHPLLFGDNLTRVFGFWTADGFEKTGCYNMLCPGFVHVHPDYGFGEVLPVSDPNYGLRYIYFRVQRDNETGNWWLFDGPDHASIGYWPKEILPHLAKNASMIKYGGIAGGIAPNKPSPPMGNGKLPTPDLDFYSSCHMLTMKVYNDQGKSESVDAKKLELKGDTTSSCYNVKLPDYASTYWGTVMFFGGPGGDC